MFVTPWSADGHSCETTEWPGGLGIGTGREGGGETALVDDVWEGKSAVWVNSVIEEERDGAEKDREASFNVTL